MRTHPAQFEKLVTLSSVDKNSVIITVRYCIYIGRNMNAFPGANSEMPYSLYSIININPVMRYERWWQRSFQLAVLTANPANAARAAFIVFFVGRGRMVESREDRLAPSTRSKSSNCYLRAPNTHLVTSPQHWLDKIDVFWIFKHFRAWKNSRTPAMASWVFYPIYDTVLVNWTDSR